jgi:hypothetical protein
MQKYDVVIRNKAKAFYLPKLLDGSVKPSALRKQRQIMPNTPTGIAYRKGLKDAIKSFEFLAK